VSTPHVSVIMPVYNAGAYLGQALHGIAAQTYRDFEVVIVDDGSTEPATATLLAEAARTPNVTVHRVPNGGPARARNLAIERARGAYILPHDADDWLAPTFLERTVGVLDAEPDVGIAYTWVGLVGRHHGTWETGGFSLEELLSRCTIHVCSLYRRAIWEQVGGYDPRFVESCEDWDFWIGAASRGWKGRGIPEVLAYYRRAETSREFSSRAPGTSARLMRNLVEKHRPLFEAHVDTAMSDMYERLAAAGVALEKIYDHPVVRVLVKLKLRLRGRA
jgi:glycosyltransferase involved in cell wall biosynthesis